MWLNCGATRDCCANRAGQRFTSRAKPLGAILRYWPADHGRRGRLAAADLLAAAKVLVKPESVVAQDADDEHGERSHDRSLHALTAGVMPRRSRREPLQERHLSSFARHADRRGAGDSGGGAAAR